MGCPAGGPNRALPCLLSKPCAGGPRQNKYFIGMDLGGQCYETSGNKNFTIPQTVVYLVSIKQAQSYHSSFFFCLLSSCFKRLWNIIFTRETTLIVKGGVQRHSSDKNKLYL